MKLQYIYLKEYRVLRNFELNLTQAASATNDGDMLALPEDYALDLLVGVNGTGKSSLLRALAEIFQRLRQYEKPGFGFALEYQTQAYPEGIFISNLIPNTHNIREPEQPLRLRIGSDSKENEVDVIDSKYLPPWIVAFTSGNEQIWELSADITDESQATNSSTLQLPTSNDPMLRNWYLSELPGKPVEDLRPPATRIDSNFLFIKADFIPLVVLCGLLFDMQQNDSRERPQNRLLQQALQECKLKALRGFSLKFRMNRELLRTEDRVFIEALTNLAHHTIQTGSDYLLVFSLQDSDNPSRTPPPRTIRPEQLLNLRGGAIGLFRDLTYLQSPDNGDPPILREINLFLAGNRFVPKEGQKPQNSPLHLFDWLSDGEQSFLSRLCLLSLLADAEVLVLLDEPEVHFNDYWKGQLIRMIVLALQQQEKHSHVFMTTHSSITLSDVSRRNIWILQREQDYTERAIPPNLRTLGTDPGDISVAIFGSENAVGSQSVQYIFQTINDAKRLDEAQQRTRLTQLLREVGPGYWRYLLRREIDALGDPQR